MRILSLFDGMACGMLAMQAAEITVDRYVAFEIDKYAIQTSSHNFPMIEHRGDVFMADFTEFYGFDYLVGGSPCTKWSIAQKNGRETEASGIGWELFCQYVRALHEVQPLYFIYENNKSMHNNIRNAITETFGIEPICINSALVSAQNRNRLYWVGKRNPDGTYSKVNVEQPEDRGILLRDILDDGCLVDKRGLQINKGGNQMTTTDQRSSLLQMAKGAIQERVDYEVSRVVDNLLDMNTEAKSGIALSSMVKIEPRVNLQPFRTFIEVGQPASEFLLRFNERGEIGFFPADGGVWKLEATRNVATYFEEKLNDLIETGAVVVIR